MVHTQPNPVISARHITVRFGERTIFENLTFDIPRGKIFVILGGSGCGKSTLLRTLTGLVRPTAGAVYYDDVDFLTAHTGERLRLQKKFGILFQSGGLIGSMTLAENILLPLSALHKQQRQHLPPERLHDIVRLKLGAVGLQGFEAFLPSEISGGMKKRAGLARAMALDPEILFFDEPSAGLDPGTSAALDALIRNLNGTLGTTMVVVTHELDSIHAIADYVIMLDKQEQGIIAAGTLDEVRTSTDTRVRRFFDRVAH